MRTAFMGVVFAWGVLTHSLVFAGPVAEVVGLKGEAVMVWSGQTIPLAVGKFVEEGSEVRTSNPGRMKLKFVDGSIVVLSDASTLKIEKFQPEGKNGPRDGRFVLDIGLISQTVAPSKDGSWVVRTPSAVTAVRGTQYIIEVASNQSTAVNVREGAVAVEPAKKLNLRSMPRLAGALSVLLNRKNHGTTCNAEGECQAPKEWSDDRIRVWNDRLSGV